MRSLLLALIALALCAPIASAEPGILYAADARGVAVTADGNALRISLPAGARTSWFTDRPIRRAGTTNLATLVRTWEGAGFAADPPNAALLLSHRGVTRTHVVMLTQPRLGKGRASFRVRAVRGGAEAGHTHEHALRAGRYGRAELFIDDAAYPPCGTSTGTITLTSTCLLSTYGSITIQQALATSSTKGMTTTAKACSTGAPFTVQAPIGTVQIPSCGTYATVSSITQCSTDGIRPPTFSNRASSGTASAIQFQTSGTTSSTTTCVPKFTPGPNVPNCLTAETGVVVQGTNDVQQCLLAPGRSFTLTSQNVTSVTVCAVGLSGSFSIATFDTDAATIIPGCGTDTSADARLAQVITVAAQASACDGVTSKSYTNPTWAPATLRVTMSTSAITMCVVSQTG